MKIVFLTNYYNHHQASLCRCLHEQTQGQFCFVETSCISDERRSLGWGENIKPNYVKQYYGEQPSKHIASHVDRDDIVIIGGAPEELLRNRFANGKVVFRYTERLYKKSFSWIKWPIRTLRFLKKYGSLSHYYLLSASAYTYGDFALHGVFKKKAYKWGYFPETKKYEDIDRMIQQKDKTTILWAGRFLDWKHPEDVLYVAKRLKQDGYSFTMYMVGTGSMESLLQKGIQSENLNEYVKLLGAMKPEEVRYHMERAGIYLFTSDFQEGWGAVLNESMNSACAVVASHAIGSVPFLIKHKENGLVYKSGDIDGLYDKVKYLLNNPEEQERMGKNAYHTITDLWNAEVAAERFLKLSEEIQDHGYCNLYEDGPCSRAEIIKNNWFKG